MYYYNEIINSFKKMDYDLNYPEIIIYSVNMAKLMELLNRKDYNSAVDYIVEKMKLIKGAGADFAAMTANTPHLLFNDIQRKLDMTVISIVEPTCEKALAAEIKRPGLIGTKFTMDAAFYPDVFNKNGMTIFVLNEEEKEIINEKLFTEIELGIFKDETRDLLLLIVEKMIQRDNIDGLILGCTEFPLILKEEKYFDIPVLSTTSIHVEKIVSYCMN